jgi:hypothetical protein
MPHSHRGAVEANANRGSGVVEASIVGASRDDVFHGVTGKSSGHERSHQHPGNGSVAVRKMENVRLIQLGILLMALGKSHALEAGKSVHRAVIRGNGIDSNGIEIVG